MEEDEFLNEIHDENGVILFYGCMDKDAAMPIYEKLHATFPTRKIVIITVAGGVVQKENHRKKALTNVSPVGAIIFPVATSK